MYISRIQVEEGFLDGLDITLTQGLNVIIGARGTGKTSLIELIRFCLGVSSYTPDSAKSSREHALSTLGSGQVTLTMSDGARMVTVSRTATDRESRSTAPYLSPIIFSQTEIENVGLQASGRLRLIDSFVSDRRRNDEAETTAISSVQSVSTEVEALHTELDDLERQLADLPSLEQQIADLAPKELQLASISSTAAEKKKILDVLSQEIASTSVAASQFERLLKGLNRWKASILEAARSVPAVEQAIALDSTATSIGETVNSVQSLLDQAIQKLDTSATQISEVISVHTVKKLADEGTARALRKEVETLQSGAGSIASTGQQLRERKAHLLAIATLRDERKKALAKLVKRRSETLDSLDQTRQRRFESRSHTCSALNGVLGPRIEVSVLRAGQPEIYASAIAEILKGSGLKYSDLSHQIADNVSPRELIELADANNVDRLAKAASLSSDRAGRALNQIRQANLGELATVLIDDDVTLRLLDGNAYKTISEVSTGQRCTVVLPIVLQHMDRPLVVDQPEDHIDNAFIVETLIKAIVARTNDSQLIVSTHNANIPVLGNAKTIVHMGSDGHRGFVLNAGSLEQPSIVSAISTVMEGGMEAFRRRAKFYLANPIP